MATVEKVNKSKVIRELLEKHGDVKFSDVQAEMEKVGVTPGMFSVIKSNWKKVANGTTPTKQKGRKKASASAPVDNSAVSVEDAVAFVREHGDLNSALSVIAAEEATLNHKRSLVAKFQEVVALAQE